jgi:lipopolysaccharide export system protein LptA
MTSKIESFLKLAGLLLLASSIVGVLSIRAAQRPGLPNVQGFKAPARYPAKPGQPERLQSLLYGDVAAPQMDGRVIIQGLRIELYPDQDSAPTNLIVRAPQCVFDRNAATAYSSNRLQVLSGDGRLSIEGIGFLWRQTNSSLQISNDVKTLIRDEPPINVVSRRFDYDGVSRRAYYREQVKAWDTQMEMSSDLLELKVPEQGKELENIIARDNVVIIGKQDNSRATGETAEYTASKTQEIINLSGHPTWQQGLREGRAEHIRFDRRTRAYHAVGNSYTKLPGSDMEQPGALFPALTATTNAPASTNQFVEIYADESDIQTNGAVFSGHVRVKDTQSEGPPASFSGGVLTLKFSPQDGKLENLTMQEAVTIEQGDSQIKAASMFYSKTNEIAEFTGGSPTWKMGGREGSAHVLRFQVGKEARALQARGQARMKLPLDTNSLALGLPPATPTNVTEVPAPSSMITSTGAPKLADVPASTTASTNRYLDIQSEDYDLQPGLAVFHGQPKLVEYQDEVAHSSLHSEQLAAQLSVPGNRLEGVVAEGKVVFEQGTPGVTNGPATYQKLTAGRLNLTTTNNVQDSLVLVALRDVIFQYGDFSATGRKLVYTGKTETVQLTGEPGNYPVVSNPRGKLTSPVVIWDRRLNRLVGGLGWTGKFEVKTASRESKRSPKSSSK